MGMMVYNTKKKPMSIYHCPKGHPDRGSTPKDESTDPDKCPPAIGHHHRRKPFDLLNEGVWHVTACHWRPSFREGRSKKMPLRKSMVYSCTHALNTVADRLPSLRCPLACRQYNLLHYQPFSNLFSLRETWHDPCWISRRKDEVRDVRGTVEVVFCKTI